MGDYNTEKCIAFADRHGGKQFMMRANNPTCDAILANGIYEYSLIDWAKQFLTKEQIFVDVGAHMGTWSCYLAAHCKFVHAYEAQRDTYNALCGSIALNGIMNIYPYNFALGDEEKTLTLNIVSKDGGGSSFLNEVNATLGTMEAKCLTLDTFDLNNIGLIKIDVEGWEKQVIMGAINTIKRCDYPKIIFEAWPDEWYAAKKKELFDYVESIGYKITTINGYNNMFMAYI